MARSLGRALRRRVLRLRLGHREIPPQLVPPGRGCLGLGRWVAGHDVVVSCAGCCSRRRHRPRHRLGHHLRHRRVREKRLSEAPRAGAR